MISAFLIGVNLYMIVPEMTAEQLGKSLERQFRLIVEGIGSRGPAEPLQPSEEGI